MNPNEIIDALGGTFRVAELCEVRPPSVSGWRKNGIPRARMMFLRIAMPNIFKDLDESAVLTEKPGSCVNSPKRRAVA